MAIIGNKYLCSRILPEIGPDGFSEWVFIDTLSLGSTVARLCRGSENLHWEVKNSGNSLRQEQVIHWAEIREW